MVISTLCGLDGPRRCFSDTDWSLANSSRSHDDKDGEGPICKSCRANPPRAYAMKLWADCNRSYHVCHDTRLPAMERALRAIGNSVAKRTQKHDRFHDRHDGYGGWVSRAVAFMLYGDILRNELGISNRDVVADQLEGAISCCEDAAEAIMVLDFSKRLEKFYKFVWMSRAHNSFQELLSDAEAYFEDDDMAPPY